MVGTIVYSKQSMYPILDCFVNTRILSVYENIDSSIHSVFKTVYVSVYEKLDSSMPWVYGMVYETSYFISKLHKLFNLLDILLLSTFEQIIWSESDS